jgi:hypothetical protein
VRASNAQQRRAGSIPITGTRQKRSGNLNVVPVRGTPLTVATRMNKQFLGILIKKYQQKYQQNKR